MENHPFHDCAYHDCSHSDDHKATSLPTERDVFNCALKRRNIDFGKLVSSAQHTDFSIFTG